MRSTPHPTGFRCSAGEKWSAEDVQVRHLQKRTQKQKNNKCNDLQKPTTSREKREEKSAPREGLCVTTRHEPFFRTWFQCEWHSLALWPNMNLPSYHTTHARSNFLGPVGHGDSSGRNQRGFRWGCSQSGSLMAKGYERQADHLSGRTPFHPSAFSTFIANVDLHRNGPYSFFFLVLSTRQPPFFEESGFTSMEILLPSSWRFLAKPDSSQGLAPSRSRWLRLKKNAKTGTVVSGNMDQNLRNPSCLILSHTQMFSKNPSDISRVDTKLAPMGVFFFCPPTRSDPKFDQ